MSAEVIEQRVDVSVLVVSFNTREETLACLKAVYAQTHEARFEVILVDNASNDGSGDAVAQRFPGVRLVQPGENLGFAAANNLAAQQAGGKYLLLLNPDTVVFDGAIDRIVRFADAHPDAGLYGGRTFFGDMSLNRNSCHGPPTPWSLTCMGLGLSSLFRRSAWLNPEGLGQWRRDGVRKVDCITGCFLLIHRDLWNRLNGFDTGFFMYGEDTDLCLRAGKLGHACLICPDAQLIHHGGRSEQVRADKMIRLFTAKHQLFRKHWKRWQVPFGVAMLSLWAFNRWAAAGCMSIFGLAKWDARQREWGNVWRRRAEYRRLA